MPFNRVTSWKPDGAAADGFIQLINSGSATLDCSGQQESEGWLCMKPFWEISPAEETGTYVHPGRGVS